MSARRQLPFYVEKVSTWFSAKAQPDIVGINCRNRRFLWWSQMAALGNNTSGCSKRPSI